MMSLIYQIQFGRQQSKRFVVGNVAGNIGSSFVAVVFCIGLYFCSIQQASAEHYPRVNTSARRLYAPLQYGHSWHRHHGASYRGASYSRYVSRRYNHHHYGCGAYGRTPFVSVRLPYPVYPPAIQAGVIIVDPLRGTVQQRVPYSSYPPASYPPGGYPNRSYPTQPIDPVTGLPLTSMMYPPANPVLRKTWDENQARWNRPVDWKKQKPAAKRPVVASSKAARLRSLRHQQHGEAHMKELKYTLAYLDFKKAVTAAPDLVPVRIQLAVSLMALGQYQGSLRHFKKATEIDPLWIYSDKTLLAYFTEENLASKEVVKERLVRWTKEDIRDSERLLLLGTILFMDQDQKKGRTLVEASARLGGVTPTKKMFFNPPRKTVAAKIVIPGATNNQAVGHFPQDAFEGSDPVKNSHKTTPAEKSHPPVLTVPPVPSHQVEQHMKRDDQRDDQMKNIPAVVPPALTPPPIVLPPLLP